MRFDAIKIKEKVNNQTIMKEHSDKVQSYSVFSDD